jgi:hypothetical protein
MLSHLKFYLLVHQVVQYLYIDVGKTSLITKFIDNQFCSIYKATIGV